MIRYLDDSPQPGFFRALSCDLVQGARVYTLYKLYEGTQSVMLWEQADSGDDITAIIAGLGASMYISSCENANIEELCEFIAFMGYKTVYSPIFVCSRLEGFTWREISVMAWNENSPAAVNTLKGITQSPKLTDVYALLCECDSDFDLSAGMESWYAHTSLLIRRGLGHCLGIYCGDDLASTAGIYAMSDTHAVIGGVATKSAYRRHGYASALISSLCGIVRHSGKIPVLLVGDENLYRWYNALGFIPVGKTCEAEIACSTIMKGGLA